MDKCLSKWSMEVCGKACFLSVDDSLPGLDRGDRNES